MKKIIALLLIALIVAFASGCSTLKNGAFNGDNNDVVQANDVDSATVSEEETVYRESTVSDEIALVFKNENGDVLLDNTDIEKIYAKHNLKNGFHIEIVFTADGKEKFANVTEEYVGRVMKLCVDDTVLMSPTVTQKISDGKVAVSGPDKESLLNMFDKIAK